MTRISFKNSQHIELDHYDVKEGTGLWSALQEAIRFRGWRLMVGDYIHFIALEDGKSE